MTLSTYINVKISGIKTVVPENCINIDDEIEYYNNDEKLLQRNKKILGLGTRYVADENVCLSDLCEDAANRLINDLNIKKESIDTLIVASTSHDYHYPATACIMQDRLGLSEDCACFDISGLACSAYVYALWNASSLIASGASKKCLVLVGDIVSRHSDRMNRNSNMLFGDAGTATILEYDENSMPSYFYLGTRGKDFDKIIAPAGGYKLPIQKDIIDIEEKDERDNVWHLWDDIMRGMDVFKFTMEVGPKGIENILDYSGTSLENIDFVAMHQANKQIVENVAKLARIPKDKYSSETFTKYANCGAGAIVTNICDQLNNRQHERVVLASFGVGLSYAFANLNLKDTNISNVEIYKKPAVMPTRQEQIDYWIKFFKGEV